MLRAIRKGCDFSLNLSTVFTGIMNNVPQIILAIFVFGLLIFVHELGHFLAAKRSKIKVNEFALGMGPAFFKRQRGDTAYSLRLFPIGGFCAMEGGDEESDDEHSFNKASLINRMLVNIAGSAMNLLLGLLILGILSANMPALGTTTIAAFGEGAVSNQWLQVGDTVKKIDNRRVRTANDIIYELIRSRDGIMDIEVERRDADGKLHTVLLRSVAFHMEEVEDGIMFITQDFKFLGVKPTFFGVIINSFNWTYSIVRQVWGGFADLVTGRYGLNQISGLVGVTSAIGQASSFGWESLFMLIAIISVNLAVFNLLPLPALDGGKMIFLLIEAVRRKPVNPRYENLVHGIGFLLLIGLMILVTVNDISKIL